MAIENPQKFDKFDKFKFSQFHEKSLFFREPMTDILFPELKMECNFSPSLATDRSIWASKVNKTADATIAVNIESHVSRISNFLEHNGKSAGNLGAIRKLNQLDLAIDCDRGY